MTTKLSFFPTAGQLVTMPDSRPMVGQLPKYVGRTYDPKTRQHKANDKPFECEMTGKRGRRLMKLARRDKSLLPSNKDTAVACGVSFVKPERDKESGEWSLPKVAKTPAPSKTPKTTTTLSSEK